MADVIKGDIKNLQIISHFALCQCATPANHLYNFLLFQCACHSISHCQCSL